jgi:hypothetical protein
MYSRFSSVDFGLVWLLIRGYINNQLDGETTTDLRVETPIATTIFCWPILTEAHRKAAVNSPY